MILSNPSTRQLVLSWDRVDALGNTLITFIALDVQRFHSIASGLIGKQSPAIQSMMIDLLNKLSTNGGVNLNEIEKHNRLIFVKNFREFVSEIKSLTLA